MPNDCWSEVFFHGSSSTIQSLLLTNLNYQDLFPSDDIECLTHFQSRHIYHTKTTITFKIWSPWTPPFAFLTSLSKKFPDLWIRCIWDEEGGQGGAWICKENSIQELQWIGPCIEAFHYDSS